MAEVFSRVHIEPSCQFHSTNRPHSATAIPSTSFKKRHATTHILSSTPNKKLPLRLTTVRSERRRRKPTSDHRQRRQQQQQRHGRKRRRVRLRERIPSATQTRRRIHQRPSQSGPHLRQTIGRFGLPRRPAIGFFGDPKRDGRCGAAERFRVGSDAGSAGVGGAAGGGVSVGGAEGGVWEFGDEGAAGEVERGGGEETAECGEGGVWDAHVAVIHSSLITFIYIFYETSDGYYSWLHIVMYSTQVCFVTQTKEISNGTLFCLQYTNQLIHQC